MASLCNFSIWMLINIWGYLCWSSIFGQFSIMQNFSPFTGSYKRKWICGAWPLWREIINKHTHIAAMVKCYKFKTAVHRPFQKVWYVLTEMAPLYGTWNQRYWQLLLQWACIRMQHQCNIWRKNLLLPKQCLWIVMWSLLLSVQPVSMETGNWLPFWSG